jgi:hypothetical protein
MGDVFTVACRSDGSIVTWGIMAPAAPQLPPGVTCQAVAAGWTHLLALCSDGSVVAAGPNYLGECNVPALPPGLRYVAVSAGEYHSLARRSDGAVVGWGNNQYGQCNAPALLPGESFGWMAGLQFDSGGVVQSGSYLRFGAGCAGSLGVTGLEALALPRLGRTMNVRALPLPLSIAAMVTGFSNVGSPAGPLPLDLSPFGLTNCALRVSPDASVLLVGANGSANFALAIPLSPSLAGLLFHQQALVFDPAAGNAAGLVMSDAATAVVGL